MIDAGGHKILSTTRALGVVGLVIAMHTMMGLACAFVAGGNLLAGAVFGFVAGLAVLGSQIGREVYRFFVARRALRKQARLHGATFREWAEYAVQRGCQDPTCSACEQERRLARHRAEHGR